MQLPDWMQPRPRIIDLEAIIEQAARKSVPWPDVTVQDDWDDDSTERPQTLEDFVGGTYIHDSADAVFKAAAKAAASAVREALHEAGWPNRVTGD